MTNTEPAPPVVPDPHPERGGDAPPAPVDLSQESVAGEEDPGASLDVDDLQPEPRRGGEQA